MAEPREIGVTGPSPQRLFRLIGAKRSDELIDAAGRARAALDGSRVWNISSTAAGGGVAEMLRSIVGYSDGIGIDNHWVVIEGDQNFFRITKRLHNRLHGSRGDDGTLGRSEADHYEAVLAENSVGLLNRIREGDVAVLHDPQTLGLAGTLAEHGVRVVWRCHVGTERSNEFTQESWHFLEPYLAPCRAHVFSHGGFVPWLLAGSPILIIAPAIDPFSAKNRPLDAARLDRLLIKAGLFEDHGGPASSTESVFGGAGPVSREDRLVVQVSRWDHLKDMAGVLKGFAAEVAGHRGVRLALVGPEVSAVSDDPEGARVLDECVTLWESLPQKVRSTIRIIELPMDDTELNALIVNAIQRHATVVVQKSLEEGFGLTVAEAMWKTRPVVASAVGGIVDQVAPGSGVLLSDPTDLAAFGHAVTDLLERPKEMAAMGHRARVRIRSHFLSDRLLGDCMRLIEMVTQE
jgi:trehalose synthase